jgi:hypothetical protein
VFFCSDLLFPLNWIELLECHDPHRGPSLVSGMVP